MAGEMLNELQSEVDKIQDKETRDFTTAIINIIPENSWKMPSARYHHMKDECGAWGNLIHTLRVVKVCDYFSEILNIQPIQRDTLKSAAILHDSCKHGINAEAVFIYREHPQLVKQLIKKAGIACPKSIADCIEQHMGRWGTIDCNWSKSNEITLAFLLHAADCIEARLEGLTKITIGGRNND